MCACWRWATAMSSRAPGTRASGVHPSSTCPPLLRRLLGTYHAPSASASWCKSCADKLYLPLKVLSTSSADCGSVSSQGPTVLYCRRTTLPLLLDAASCLGAGLSKLGCAAAGCGTSTHWTACACWRATTRRCWRWRWGRPSWSPAPTTPPCASGRSSPCAASGAL